MTPGLLFAVIGLGSPDGDRSGREALAACDTTRMAAVAFLQGRWQVRSDEPTRSPRRVRTGVATVTAIAGGCALQERLRLEDGHEEVRILAFDERTAAWQLALVDSEHGNIVILKGHAEGAGLEFISTHQRRDALLVDRISMQRTSTGWLTRTETAPGYGRPWRLLQEITYAREP